MCFSASASFITAAALVGTSAVIIKRTNRERHMPVLLIPFFFGVQQFIEGIQWIVDKPGTCSTIAAYGFLFFAFVFWPIYIPFAIRYAEPDKARKKILNIFLGIGIAVGAYLLFFIIKNPVSAATTQSGIRYILNIPHVPYGFALYVLATCGSAMISSYRFFRIFGLAAIAALATALYFYYQTWPSIWCFFAAVLSAILAAFYIFDKKSATKIDT